jgi:hypothetical protein
LVPLDVREGEEFSLDLHHAQRLRQAAERLRTQLSPRFQILQERAGTFKISNIIGTIDLGGGALIHVSPKVPSSTNWVASAIWLLTGSENIEVAGQRRAGTSSRHNHLLEALARIYLSRLQKAYRQDGPIVLMERVSRTLPYLHGKLDVTRWAKSAAWRPHVFPVNRTELAQDNPYSRGLMHVANRLAHISKDPKVRNGLHTVSRDLSAGLPLSSRTFPPNTLLSLPEQWKAYEPAWSLAKAILTRTSLFGASGNFTGVGLAIEAWPLLETLLEKTLADIQRLGRGGGRNYSYRMQGAIPLLTPTAPPPQRSFSPEPDGRLFCDGRLLATFEAKYSRFDGRVPSREHTYQCLSTAAACGASTAVLVYPDNFLPMSWNVSGFQGHPSRLIAIGLDMFRWPPPSQPESRAGQVMAALNGALGSASSSIELVAA